MTFRCIDFGSDEFKKERELRNSVLRIPLGLSLSDEDLAAEQSQKHFGLFDEAENLVGCVIAVPLSPADVQIRQMAVIGSHQRRGYGRKIIRHLEERLAESGYVHVFMNARTSAIGFYEKLGYTRIGDEFLAIGIPHIRMEKHLAGKWI